ncbi:MAG: hypothetical protein K8R68_11375 [Bacteroidales bacterium]|nr:hypothetical protein [Bacteroidales bacterium]
MDTSNYQWLKDVAGIESKSWHNDHVMHVGEIENSEYYIWGKRYNMVIDPKLIKGIIYSYGYNDNRTITWIKLLESLKRFDYVRKNFTTKSLLIDHVHNDYNQPKSLRKYGDIYFTTSGQHRMALAKFLEVPEVKVEIIEYKYDPDSYRAYDYFE